MELTNEIQIGDLTFVEFISQEEILRKVEDIAHQISKEHHDKVPLFLVIMNGAFMFAADLIRKLDFPAELVFIRVKSYHGTESTGNIKIFMPEEVTLAGRHVIILEDIIDTGNSMSSLLPALEKMSPASLTLTAILVKPEAHQHDIPITYPGFEIPNKFVVGYGLDYNGIGRNLPAIYQLKK
ncbi:MAG: hypoxanthine phosphoribosyltransferase [Saprospiraceae bacterium]